MPPIRTARFSERADFIRVPGARESSLQYGDDDNLHALVTDFGDVSLISLTRAVNEFRERIGEKWIWMYFYAQEPDSFEPFRSPREPFNLEFFGNQMRVRADYDASTTDPAPWPDFLRLMARFLEQRGARVMRTEHQDNFGRIRHFVDFDLVSLRGLRVSDARALALDVSTLAGAVALRGTLDAAAVKSVITAGQAHLLIGQHEHQSFEAKTVAYELSTHETRYELAKDVAAFSNGGEEGLLVCGLKTKTIRGTDIVVAATPVELSSVRPRDWIRRIRNLVVPAPEGLRVSVVPRGGARGYVLIEIPRQPENLKPFLIRVGRRKTGRIVETDITVPIRIGEDTDYADAAALHGMLAAGRVALRFRPGVDSE
jgi:hypothetical protein